MGEIYYIYEPERGGVTIYENAAAFKKAVDEFCFNDSYCDDGWDEYVTDVTAGVAPYVWEEKHEDIIEDYDFYQKHATYTVEMTGKINRPDNIDEDGYCPDSVYWGEYKYICGYKFEEQADDI